METGPVFLLLVGVPTIFYYFVFLWKSAQGLYCAEMALLGGLLMLNTQLFRGDKQFLRLVSDRRFLIFWVEYTLMWLPFLVTFLMTEFWYYTPALLAWAGLVALIPITLRPRAANFLKLAWIPASMFEWRSGLRRWGWVYAGILLAGLALGRFTEAAPAAMVLLAILAASFNTWAEPAPFLQVFPQKPLAFLLQKWFTQTAFYLFSIVPLILSFLILHPETWLVFLALLFVSLLTIFFSILFKYALYAPNRDLKNNLWFILLQPLCLIKPWTLPIPLVMLAIYWFKSLRNLKDYLQ